VTDPQDVVRQLSEPGRDEHVALLAEPTLQLLGPSGHVKRGHRRRASLRGRVRLQPQFRAALATPRRGRPVSLPNRIESLLYEQPERRVERHDLGRKVGVREPLQCLATGGNLCTANAGPAPPSPPTRGR